MASQKDHRKWRRSGERDAYDRKESGEPSIFQRLQRGVLESLPFY